MAEISPTLTRYNMVESANYFKQASLAAQLADFKLKPLNLRPRYQELSDFYMTDSISRASKTMAKCVKAAKGHSYDI